MHNFNVRAIETRFQLKNFQNDTRFRRIFQQLHMRNKLFLSASVLSYNKVKNTAKIGHYRGYESIRDLKYEIFVDYDYF